uniref:RRM domain-containing protein n=1 Tax=Strigamia maritima TaxID=126957 RepID=T1ISN3_STRMM
MGDYNFGVNSNVRALSPADFHQNTSNASLFFPEPIPRTMQDELLLDKACTVKQQQLSSSTETNAELSSEYGTRKANEDENSPVSQDNKKIEAANPPAGTSPLQLAFSEPPCSAAITSTNQSFWSTASAEDTFIQGIPAMNGTLTFQNFAPAPNPLFNTNLGPQITIPQQPQPQPQRRAITATHNFPHTRHHQTNLFMPAAANNSKTYSSWSNPQQSTWSAQAPAPAPQPQQQQQPPPPNSHSPWNSVQQRRNVPNLNPISPMKKSGSTSQQQSISISPSKFRRSTSLPSKNFPHAVGSSNPTFEISNVEDNRDTNTLLPIQTQLLHSVMDMQQFRQDRHITNNSSPLDTMRLSGLEHYLNDIMRSAGDNQEHLKGKSPFFTGIDDNHLLEDGHLDQTVPSLSSPSRGSPRSQGSSDTGERYSRKVFVGGLPPDIDEEEITASFRRFGPLVVDWPHKAESKSYFPPKGYAFLLFQDESSVQNLIDACIQDDDKLYLCVSSPTIKDKPVQIRPWRLSDADFVLDGSLPLDPRKTVFVGGVPRPLKAVELAMIMDRLYGGVCYAGIDTDPELKYPKGAGRVAFSNQQSYIAAISARFVQLQHGDIDKRVEVKPYVLDDQMCDECQGTRCGGKFAPFFCANVTCLQYYCEHCWATIHSRAGREFHKPLVKEGADRPRAVPFRWC